MTYITKQTFSHIIKKSGRKPTECRCERCRAQCHTPCLGTPEDITKLINAGYQGRLSPTLWAVGMLLGLTERPIKMIQANVEANGWCTFYHDGLCELHDKGLKPTEGRLSHHSVKIDNFVPKKSLSWLVAKEWLPYQEQL